MASSSSWSSPVVILGGSVLTAGVVAAAKAFIPAKRSARGKSQKPTWRWSDSSNIVALGTAASAASYLMKYWADSGKVVVPAKALAKPGVVLALAAGVAAPLYLLTRVGGALLRPREAAAPAAGAEPAPMEPEYDADVVIIGAGCVGAALATALARQGKKVVVVENTMDYNDRIIGELMQPGGMRALEAMGIADCAKTAAIDPVMVDGYACITPNTPACKDLVLTYPPHDPDTLVEYYLGVLGVDKRPVRINNVHAGAVGAEGGAGATGAGAPASATPSMADDEAPCGRSFHNHLFVQELRKRAIAEKNVQLHLGYVKKLVTPVDLAAPASTFVGSDAKSSNMDVTGLTMADLRTSVRPAPLFAGYDEHDKSKGSLPVPPPAPGAPAPAPVPVGKYASDTDTVGVAWIDKSGVEHVTTGRITVIADGNYSSLRGAVHKNAPATVSYCCGLILHHAPGASPLPYPNRGHVLMSDPHPVLLYQISSTETRVLVDMPKLLNVEDGSMRKYFEDVIAPQMPECVRDAFLHAARTQEPSCAANRLLTTAPYQGRGAVLLGDSWNMRHPLTGGGMTVALKDVELFVDALRGQDLQHVPWNTLTDRLNAFQVARQGHATTINVLAVALYRVFSRPASDEDGTRERLRAACIEYLSMGGPMTAGPVSLLAGLTPEPDALVSHFFAVALHAMRRSLLPVPTPSRIRQGYDLLHIACQIIMPLVALEKHTWLACPPVLGLVNLLFPWREVDPIAMR